MWCWWLIMVPNQNIMCFTIIVKLILILQSVEKVKFTVTFFLRNKYQNTVIKKICEVLLTSLCWVFYFSEGKHAYFTPRNWHGFWNVNGGISLSSDNSIWLKIKASFTHENKVSGLILPSQSSEKPTALQGASLNDPTQGNTAEKQKHFANHIRRDVDAFKMTFM